MVDLKIVVEEIRGFCDLPMHVGDHFFLRGGRIYIPDGQYVCMWALQSLMPILPAKQRKSAETNDWIPHTTRICCPDPNGQVIWRIDVLGEEEEALPKQPPKRMLVDENQCCGCRRCELVCSFAHAGAYASWLSRVQIHKDDAEGLDQPRVCRQCGNARCVQVCPAGALTKDSVSGAIKLEIPKCIGCGQCRKNCSFGAIHWNDEARLPLICDLCGGQPQCVAECPTKALTFGLAGDKEGEL